MYFLIVYLVGARENRAQLTSNDPSKKMTYCRYIVDVIRALSDVCNFEMYCFSKAWAHKFYRW